MTHRRSILFSGYAPVHFVCFQPLYDRLAFLPGVDVFVSGGLRTKTGSGYSYDASGLYAPLEVPGERILTVDEIRKRDFDVLFSAHSKKIEPRNAATSIQIFHGLSFRNKAVRPENTGYDYYFVVGPYMRRRFCEAGLFAEDDPRIVPVGFMKTDRLLNGELSRAELLRRHGLDGSRPILLYAPTGAKHNSLETMGEEAIRRLAQENRYDLLIKPHDHPKNRDVDWLERLRPLESEHCKVVRDADVIPLAFLADLLISDASSVSNEYALLDRPMLFLDVPELIHDAAEKRGSMLDLDTWGRKGGAIVKRAEDVPAAVARACSDPGEHAAVRRAMVRDLFYNPGRATDAALRFLEEKVLRPMGGD